MRIPPVLAAPIPPRHRRSRWGPRLVVLALGLGPFLSAASAAPAAATPAYTLTGAEDWSDGSFFRARFRVATAEPISPATAEAIARDLVERRTSRRVLHVVEVRIHPAGASAGAPPGAVVLWAAGGDPERRPSGAADDYASHTYTVRVGADAAAAVTPSETPTPPVAAPAPPPPEVRPVPGAAGPVTAPAPIRADDRKALAKAEVLTVLRGWRSAWEGKDLDAYLAYYAPEFRSGAMNLAAWSAHKTQVFERAGEVHVEIEEIEVAIDGDQATATFVQDYRAADHQDRGRKTLVFHRVGGAYKIAREDWSRL